MVFIFRIAFGLCVLTFMVSWWCFTTCFKQCDKITNLKLFLYFEVYSRQTVLANIVVKLSCLATSFNSQHSLTSNDLLISRFLQSLYISSNRDTEHQFFIKLLIYSLKITSLYGYLPKSELLLLAATHFLSETEWVCVSQVAEKSVVVYYILQILYPYKLSSLNQKNSILSQ